MDNISKENQRKIKLANIIRKLGLSYLDSINIINIDDGVDYACWVYNQADHSEKILINPNIIDVYSDHTIEMLLRHEILHRSFYNGFNYKFDDEELMNIVLDVSINKLLKLAYPDKSKFLFRLYNAPCYDCELVLSISDVDVHGIHNQKLRKLYQEIWENEEMPSPESIYYKLMELEHNKSKNNESRGVKEAFQSPYNPFKKPTVSKRKYGVVYRETTRVDNEETLDNKESKNKQLNRDTINEIKIKTNRYGNKSFFEEYHVDIKSINTDPLKKFVKEIRDIRQLSKITSSIRNELVEKDRLQVYPLFLSRIGLIYNAMGVNDAIPLYWNRSMDYTVGNKHKIALYIDTSASMWNYMGYIGWVIKQFDDFSFSSGDKNKECYGFDIKIYPLTLKSISQGYFKGRGGTSYNTVINHFLNLNDGSDVAFIFTDGYSELDDDIINTFKSRNDKKVFAIYFTEKGDEEIQSSLNDITERYFIMVVDRNE